METIRRTERTCVSRCVTVATTRGRHAPRAGTPTIAALVSDPASGPRIGAALSPLGTLYFAANPRELLEGLVRFRIKAVVVEPCSGDGGTEALVARVRRDFPLLPVLLYCHLTAAHMKRIPGLVRAGADEVLLGGVDDTRAALQRLLLHAASTRSGDGALEALRGVVPDAAEPVLAYCLTHADRPLTVDEMARGLGVHRKTLCNRTLAAGLPAPSVLISWCRLLHAARLLDDAERSVERIALLLGFGSGTALRNMLRRYTGLRPTELRRRGGPRVILALFEKQVTERPTGSASLGDLPS